ncbi:MAG TPA: DNA methyltransferase [Nonomuraea sp.]|nr:DNA methyltransferase [Nonomuraea sp.]
MTKIEPYYQDDLVTLYHGDCRQITEWLAADVLVMDPPYGIGWSTGRLGRYSHGKNRQGISYPRPGISGDQDTSVRDAALALWGGRLAVVFGAMELPPPLGTCQKLVYQKPPDAGARGAHAGYRRDLEAIYLVGPWPAGVGGASSLISTGARCAGSPSGIAARAGHPHAKPVDVMAALIATCPPGQIADPFAGSGSTLLAAKQLGVPSIGVELEECHCERAAERLSVPDLFAAVEP